jgi:hypothetical protein
VREHNHDLSKKSGTVQDCPGCEDFNATLNDLHQQLWDLGPAGRMSLKLAIRRRMQKKDEKHGS